MADDSAIESFLESYEQQNAVTEAASISHPPATCCCGNNACTYLQHNQNALEGLERDVRSAAKLGQALLTRHEAYIADSERERKAMMEHIDSLEAEKQALEQKNSSVIAENRGLLNQLEAINNAVAESDAQVASLQATLQATQQELQKVSYLAARSEQLEAELEDFEREQTSWQVSLAAKEESEKSAVQRWQKAQRRLAEMQEQLERIEREAKEEKEHHVEVVGRMERLHSVERELNSAAGRLKGAAAAKTASKDSGGTNVVSHFVKDILQDNTNLQMGIVELREMLQSSNDEVESLRRQVLEHQPAESEDTPQSDKTIKHRDLREELQRATSQELHVHHHYHAPPPAPRQTPTIRRPKRRRYGALTPNHFTPPTSGHSTPRSSISYGTPSSAVSILQHTAVSVPQQVPKSNRFSAQSTQTYQSALSSSGPSSPQSTTNRTSSIYDRVFSDAGHESSRPTTPDTEYPGSPIFAPVHQKRASASSFRTYSSPAVQRSTSPGDYRFSLDSVLGTSLDEALAAKEQTSGHDAIPEENEAVWQDENTAILEAEPDSNVTSPVSDELLEPIHDLGFWKQPLRRAASHESLLSISGMDIHTLRTRPSQLLAGNGGRSFTSEAVISDAYAQATRPAMSRPLDSGRSLLSGMASEQRLQNKPSLGSKVGGWVFGRWGAAPAPTPNDKTGSKGLPSRSLPPNGKLAAGSQDEQQKLKLRNPGINQPGPILGFPSEVKQQHLPVVKRLDEEALKKALGN